jgi:cytochrome c oxidase cbb3-type subunit II
MKSIEKFSGIFLLAGVVLFAGATLSLGIVPAVMVDRVHPKQGLPLKVAADFADHYKSVDAYTDALLRGRDLYIREGCWHCHSQYVRPVSNENLMYGPVSTPGEYQTVLHRPQLFGTRRVGPDLSREAGKRSNDWHYAHLYKPVSVVPESVMPTYPWYFNVAADGTVTPTEDAVALVAYLQNLGADVQARADNQWDSGEIILPPKAD